MLIALADDLTGACEVAAAGHRHGLRACVSLAAGYPPGEPGLLVCDTDSRLLPDGLCAEKITHDLVNLGLYGRQPLLFKKVDSVLRGPVATELRTIAEHLGYGRILLVPANPELGRTVQGGEYRIHDVPLDQTDFARDPHHPARSASVTRLLGQRGGLAVTAAGLGEPLPGSGLIVGDASTADDLRGWAERIDATMLAAGSGAFFTAVLRHHWNVPAQPHGAPHAPDALAGTPALLVSGTTSSACRPLREALGGCGQPLDRTSPGDLAGWSARLQAELDGRGATAAFFEHTKAPDPDRAPAVTAALVEIAGRLVAGRESIHLLVEGGATAAAIARRLGWKHLRVVHEWSPGVVCLSPVENPRITCTLKPGTYPWSEAI
jgi:D-threonate/D-erythronate kinase